MAYAALPLTRGHPNSPFIRLLRSEPGCNLQRPLGTFLPRARARTHTRKQAQKLDQKVLDGHKAPTHRSKTTTQFEEFRLSTSRQRPLARPSETETAFKKIAKPFDDGCRWTHRVSPEHTRMLRP